MLGQRFLHASRKCQTLLQHRITEGIAFSCEGATPSSNLGSAACSKLPLIWSAVGSQGSATAAGRAFSPQIRSTFASPGWAQGRAAQAVGNCNNVAPNQHLLAGAIPASFTDSIRFAAHPSESFHLGVPRLLHNVVSPPGKPTPEHASPSATAPAASDEYDEADHAHLAQQLEAQHGPADPVPGVEDAGSLSGEGPHQARNIAEAATILRHANMAHLREELEALSERQATIPYEHLLDLCQKLGAAGTRAEAQAVAQALCTAGTVLRFRTQVYLRPDEVAHGVLSALPDTLEDLQAREAELEAELEPLRQHKVAVDRAAHRRSKAVMWGGFALLVGQFSLFYWLTWYELSWDVMEPVAYFVSLGTAIAFYLFFLMTNEPFDYRPFQQKLFSRWQRSRLNETHFDQQTYDRLVADLARYRRYIAHFKRA
mmetsp:Transcript_9907/g.29757  ORF Transcript_9907/g.29757 Transcript_9907/m.29757 type:complete len:428 (+) Transcript_9907:110-1393(+)